MNFLRAINHSIVGYGIRRPHWHEKAILHYEHSDHTLRWVSAFTSLISNDYIPENSHYDPPSSEMYADFIATDWQVI